MKLPLILFATALFVFSVLKTTLAQDYKVTDELLYEMKRVTNKCIEEDCLNDRFKCKWIEH